MNAQGNGRGTPHRSLFFGLYPLTFLVLFAAYLRTTCPTIFFGDSAEFQAAAWSLGICHPPGYPLYIFLAASLKYLPFGEAAFRFNLFSALTMAGAGVLLGRLAGKWTGKKWVVPVTAGFFAFGTTTWSQAVMAEVYGLNALACFAVLTAAVEALQRKSGRWLLTWGFLSGLAMTNHNGASLAVVGTVVPLVLWAGPLVWKHLGRLMALGALGCSVYAGMPIRSVADPAVDWGDIHLLSQFWAQVSRQVYGELTHNPYSPGLLVAQHQILFQLVLEEYGWPILLLGVGGLLTGWRRSRRETVIFGFFGLAAAWAYLPLLNFRDSPLDIFLIRVFLGPGMAMIPLFAAVGLSFLASCTGRGGRAGVSIGALLLTGWLLISRWGPSDLSRHWLGNWFSSDLFRSMPRNTVFFEKGDNQLFPLSYSSIVARERPDVTIVEGAGHFQRVRIQRLAAELGLGDERFSWDLLEEAVRESLHYHALYSVAPLDKKPVLRSGLVEELLPEGAPPRPPWWPVLNWQPPGELLFIPDFMTCEVLGKYWYHHLLYVEAAMGTAPQEELARLEALAGDNKYLQVYLGRYHEDHGDPVKAIAAYRRALDIDPSVPSVGERLGVLLAQAGDDKAAGEQYRQALEKEPNNPVLLFNYANSLKRRGKVREAVDFYLKALSLKQDFPEAANNLANAFETLKEWQKAAQTYEAVLKLTPDSALLWANFGNFLMGFKKAREAEQAFLRALELDPSMAAPHANLGSLYLYDLNRTQEGLAHYHLYLDSGQATAEQRRSIEEILKRDSQGR